jgi:hypothetical protein
MDVYTQPGKKQFLMLLNVSTIASNGSQLSLWICSNAKVDRLFCHIVARIVFTRFKTLKVPMSHKDDMVLTFLWDTIPTLLSIFLLQV